MLTFELEESMLIPHARYIRGSTLRPYHRYYIQRCRSGELDTTAIHICERQAVHLQRQRAKGVVYCLGVIQSQEIAEALNCLYYHSKVVDREERLQHWLTHGGLIVATSALGTGVDISGIVFVLHVGMPWGLIEFAQASGRAGRSGETVDSVIVVETGSVERRITQGSMTLDQSAMATFITTTTCRRQVMSTYLDGPALAQSCMTSSEYLRCDRCGEGFHEYIRRLQRESEERELVRQAMDELVTGCVWCWLRLGEDVSDHGTQHCPEARSRMAMLDGLIPSVEEFRRQIRYQADTHSCHKCGISQKICATGQEEQQACQWPGIMAPLMFQGMLGREMFREIQAIGFEGEFRDFRGYSTWLGKRHVRRVWNEVMSNGMAVAIRVIRYSLYRRTQDYVRSESVDEELK